MSGSPGTAVTGLPPGSTCRTRRPMERPWWSSTSATTEAGAGRSTGSAGRASAIRISSWTRGDRAEGGDRVTRPIREIRVSRGAEASSREGCPIRRTTTTRGFSSMLLGQWKPRGRSIPLPIALWSSAVGARAVRSPLPRQVSPNRRPWSSPTCRSCPTFAGRWRSQTRRRSQRSGITARHTPIGLGPCSGRFPTSTSSTTPKG